MLFYGLEHTCSRISFPMGLRQSVPERMPEGSGMAIEVIDLEPESETVLNGTGYGNETVSATSTSANTDGRSRRNSSDPSAVAQGLRDGCIRLPFQATFERNVVISPEVLTPVNISNVNVDETVVDDDDAERGVITFAPNSNWLASSSEDDEEMEEGEITADEENCQENQSNISNQANPSQGNLVTSSEDQHKESNDTVGRAVEIFSRQGLSKEVQQNSQVVTISLEDGHENLNPELSTLRILKEQNASLQEANDSLNRELVQARHIITTSYNQGMEAGEKEFQRKFQNANEEEILRMANGNASTVNNSAVTLLGHLLELRREKMAVVECANKELTTKLAKLEAEKDELFGLLCKSNGRVLAVTESAVALEQQVEDFKILLARKDAQIRALGEDSLVVSNAISRIQTSLQMSVNVAVPAVETQSSQSQSSNIGQQLDLEMPEARSFFAEQSQCPTPVTQTQMRYRNNVALMFSSNNLLSSKPEVPAWNPISDETARPDTSTKENASVKARSVPAAVPKVVKTSTRRVSPKSTRRISRRSPSRRSRERVRERKWDEDLYVTSEERKRVLKLLPGLENWQDYTIKDIKYRKQWWICPQCGMQ
ncbi:unnamed protein product [Orchesella dallaii]|uniref:Uncharacterized protein n=1 Tax=Orchesella dallaii TaxID=48710 RepID=A0ABP1QFA3_9HEXA